MRRLTMQHVYRLGAGLLFAALLTFGIYQYVDKTVTRNSLYDVYSRSLRETAGYIDDMDKLLGKLSVVSAPAQTAPIFAEIWGKASAAHESLINLPYDQIAAQSSIKYLSQASDFSYAMMNRASEGLPMTEKDLANLAEIKKYSKEVSSEMNRMIASANTENGIRWASVAKESGADGKAASKLLGSISAVQKTFENYPALIYDGPFSDHRSSEKPKLVQGAKKITPDEGKRIIMAMFPSLGSVNYTQELTADDPRLPLYSYELLPRSGTALYMTLTQNGGYPVWMLGEPPTDTSGGFIDAERAIEIAEGFLSRNSFKDMKYSYYELSDYAITINYAPVIGGVIMYPDLIKIKVSLVSGEIIGLEAMGYVANHHDRVLPGGLITEEAARAAVSPAFQGGAAALAVIPKDNGSEALCYELSGKADGKDYLVYVNAYDGSIENIYLLMVSAYGVLAE